MNTERKKLNDCGCCEGVKALTPVCIENRPGLSALAYRIGTHSQFKQSLLAQLTGKGLPALRQLTTRENDDPSIALLDSWAVVLDVLTFYQERIANEGYLHTATERRSILELARSIGYELRPGVATSTYLAFTLEDRPVTLDNKSASSTSVTIRAGTKVQSVPKQDELPQIFETIEEIEALAEWSELKPMTVEKHLPAIGDTDLYLKGITTNLKAGDPLLIVGEEREKDVGIEEWEFRRIREVKTDAKNERTYIFWDKPLGNRIPRVKPPAVGPKVYALRLRAAIFGHNAPDWDTLPVALRIGEKDPNNGTIIPGAFAGESNDWANKKFGEKTKVINLDAVYSQIVFNGWIVLSSPDYAAELYRVKEIDEETIARYNMTAKTTRLRISGEHIEKFGPRTATVFAQSEQLELADRPVTKPVFGSRIDLNRQVVGLQNGRPLIISGRPLRCVKVAERTQVFWKWNWEEVETKPELFLVSADGSKQKKMKSGDVLDIVGLPEEGKSKGQIKWHLKDKNGFIGFVSTEPDELVPEPETLKDEPVNQARSGSDTEETVSEVIFLDSMEVNDDLTTLVFTANLQNVYRRESVTIYGNVAASTHGETKAEVLGSGDGSKAFQKFSLKQKPLTYISAPTPNGVKSTLEIRVNDILWEEEPSFYRLSPKKRAYITKMNDDGTVTVQFGDGITGTRLPTGIENVKATYRVGTGLNGMVDANQLSLLMTRPLGVKEVINPLAATGADDPEQRDQARKNAPLTVLTLDRIVSLQDFEDFARSFSGIGKAQAGLVWNGEKELVHITVAAADGGEVDKNSNLYKNLVAGIDSARHSYQNIQIDSYIPLLFNVQAKVLVDSAYLVENVLMEVSIAIKDTFDFEHRGLGEAVTASDVMVVMQQTKGVVAVDLDTLEFMNNVDKSEVKYGPFPMKTIKSKKVFSSLRLASRLVTRTRGKIDLSRIKPKRTDLDLRLPAHTARWDKNTKTIKAAELLIVNPEGIKLTGTTV